ncbi:hypothetical protein CJD36_012130 [Flavipsychrobacter stenotrophus]|uniref:DUF4252 domain-containing protein n=1 Tax=Flavipsychrobacter stenotrophus TaxID=2077091 RepID=A0A2S7SVF4_9BACT|nr:hypothetical protein [Flavipsychrobacter stenotrophus]PQJ10714.1 hypothetical protein CJD36_012130 [Flavipsychrobacter stenotrophus]
MNRIYRLLILITLTLPSFAHAQEAKETMLKKGKEHIPGYTIKLRHSRSLTAATLKETMQEAGLKKAKHKKGFYTYKGVVLMAISSSKQDYYYKVTGNKRKTTVHFAVSKGYDNYVTSANDSHLSMSISGFLTELNNKVGVKEQLNQKQTELDEIEKEKARKQAEIDKLQKQTR